MSAILPLEIDRVSYAERGVRLLDEVSLTVAPGRRLVIIGPNGAGKSLLLRLCHGLIRPASGSIRWASGEARPAGQAMVFQRPVLLRRSVAANIAYPLTLAGLDRAARRERTDEALTRFGLSPLADRPARRLSGGEQQRLAMARAWATRPEAMFLDEPTSALDPAATRAIEAMIREFSAEGVTMAMTTHDLGQARRLAEDVAFLHRGRLIETGPARAFFDAPRTDEARRFLAGDLIW